MQDWENAGTPLELILLSDHRKVLVATFIASGIVKMYKIGKSAGRV